MTTNEIIQVLLNHAYGATAPLLLTAVFFVDQHVGGCTIESVVYKMMLRIERILMPRGKTLSWLTEADATFWLFVICKPLVIIAALVSFLVGSPAYTTILNLIFVYFVFASNKADAMEFKRLTVRNGLRNGYLREAPEWYLKEGKKVGE